MPRLSIIQRDRIIQFKNSGLSNRKIAKKINCDEKSVRNTLKRYKMYETLLDMPKSGRPRVTTERDDRSIKLESLRDRFKTSPEIQKNCGLVDRVNFWKKIIFTDECKFNRLF